MYIAVQILVAWAYSHLLEYILHQILHDFKHAPFLFKYHFSRHHKISRKNNMKDESYDKIFKTSSLFEIGSIFLGLVLHLPLFFIFPFFYAVLVFSAIQYYMMHRKSHIDVEWGKKNMPWHYEHHMGKNQDANWGVTTDWVDRLMGTRIRYEDRKPKHPMINLK